jgi:hypothetical protein
MEVGGATVTATDVGGLGGSAGEEAEVRSWTAPPWQRRPAARVGARPCCSTNCLGPSVWETNLSCPRHNFRKYKDSHAKSTFN